MARLLGVLLGSALAIAALIVLAGVPKFLPMSATPMAGPPADAPQPLELPPQSSLAEARTPAPQVAAEETESAVIRETPAPELEPEPQPETQEPRWHAFWSPFRSRIAANGFVEQLQRVTGLDYRVVNLKPGVYEVAFAYTEDAEIAVYLEQISHATGLDVTGS